MTGVFQPIFVLGLQRSGTTWASNLLAAHPQIAAIEADRHHGVHESVFFSHFARMFGPWSDPHSKSRALSAFLKSDYLALSGISREQVRALAAATQEAGEFFAAFMDHVAEARGAVAWVEKSPHHTLLAEDLAATLPTARFLCITRRSRTLVRSRLWSYGRTPSRYPVRALHILRACASNAFYSRYLSRFAASAGPDRACLLSFETLQMQGAAALDPFLEACGLAPMGETGSRYARNSSFSSHSSRAAAMGRLDVALVTFCDGAMTLVPVPLLQALQRRIAAKRPNQFPEWVWADTIERNIAEQEAQVAQ